MLPSLGTLALSAFLAATFLPGTTEVVLTGLILAADIDLWLLVTVASVFNVLGSVVNYAIGRFLERFDGSRLMPVSRHRLEQARRWFDRWGVWALLLSWVPFVGDAFPVLAGYMRVNPWKAFPLIAIGKTTRFVVLGLTVTGGASVMG